jgi:hypothetical protein
VAASNSAVQQAQIRLVGSTMVEAQLLVNTPDAFAGFSKLLQRYI